MEFPDSVIRVRCNVRGAFWYNIHEVQIRRMVMAYERVSLLLYGEKACRDGMRAIVSLSNFTLAKSSIPFQPRSII